jgi:hypothetical protein
MSGRPAIAVPADVPPRAITRAIGNGPCAGLIPITALTFWPTGPGLWPRPRARCQPRSIRRRITRRRMTRQRRSAYAGERCDQPVQRRRVRRHVGLDIQLTPRQHDRDAVVPEAQGSFSTSARMPVSWPKPALASVVTKIRLVLAAVAAIIMSLADLGRPFAMASTARRACTRAMPTL